MLKRPNVTNNGGPKGKLIDHEGKNTDATKYNFWTKELKTPRVEKAQYKYQENWSPEGIETVAKKQPKVRNYVHGPITTSELSPTEFYPPP